MLGMQHHMQRVGTYLPIISVYFDSTASGKYLNSDNPSTSRDKSAKVLIHLVAIRQGVITSSLKVCPLAVS